MKKILIILTVILLNSFLFSESFVGFQDIEFGSSKETAISKMKEKGWSSFSGFEENTEEFFGKTYGNKSVAKLTFSFDLDNNFYQAQIFFSDTVEPKEIEEIYRALINKYNLYKLGETDTITVYTNNNNQWACLQTSSVRNLLTHETKHSLCITLLDRDLSDNNKNKRLRTYEDDL